jgi:hypothetical protein
MSVGLPFWLLFGSQKVTIKITNSMQKPNPENKKGNSAAKGDERKSGKRE